MGQARQRGTFEERKAQAIAEGREKKPAVKRRRPSVSSDEILEYLPALLRYKIRL